MEVESLKVPLNWITHIPVYISGSKDRRYRSRALPIRPLSLNVTPASTIDWLTGPAQTLERVAYCLDASRPASSLTRCMLSHKLPGDLSSKDTASLPYRVAASLPRLSPGL
jgi:hypothetical protein